MSDDGQGMLFRGIDGGDMPPASLTGPRIGLCELCGEVDERIQTCKYCRKDFCEDCGSGRKKLCERCRDFFGGR